MFIGEFHVIKINKKPHMKQPIWILAACTLLIMSCGRKTVPAKTTDIRTTNSPAVKAPEHKNVTVTPVPVNEEKGKTDTKKEIKEELLPMVVIDGMGNIITPKEKLPEEIAAKADYRILSRAFTPNQRTNLVYRYKIVPPRILFVPESYIKTTSRGKYVVYRKKFWYWQKEDGLFYLDETYYK
jgi:hypothetical protein